ncbi:dUTP diphosphatase [Peribacillus sp. SCS-26]|uniref:dUTP diphosphatase n=1 Tax=Paraperibacillus marinus TaxID=3115295 RepID=UPI003906AD73
MNLKNLFDMQKVLIDRIGYQEPDKFEKTVLALLVEVGECANEWRGFKYWSKDQLPRTKGAWKYSTGIENGMFIDIYENPLLEEYVDGLHFVLQLGIEINCTPCTPSTIQVSNITTLFNFLYSQISQFSLYKAPRNYSYMLETYLGLGNELGFTWEQIERAYMDKNEINHLRQEQGY